MEIAQLEILNCRNCKKEVNASAKFCPGCGKQAFKAIRSENEIRAKIQEIQNIDGAEIQTLMMSLPVCFALEWVLGADIDPIEFFKKLSEKEQKNEKSKGNY